MKKTAIIVCFILIVSIITGCKTDVEESFNENVSESSIHADTSEDTVSNNTSETPFTMYRYVFVGDGYGIGGKTIGNDEFGNKVLDELSNLKETGKTVSEIPYDGQEEYDLPVEHGTAWIECELGTFRINKRFTEIYKVDGWYGKGKVLQMTESLTTLLWQAWQYYPYDFWEGEYENGSVILERKFKAETIIDTLEIDSIYVENKIDSYDNKITVVITSKESKTVNVSFDTYQSPDNLGSMDSKEIQLKAGEPVSVDFTFYGFYNCTYWAALKVDNTTLELTIQPE